jgi:hypothetical protein
MDRGRPRPQNGASRVFTLLAVLNNSSAKNAGEAARGPDERPVDCGLPARKTAQAVSLPGEARHCFRCGRRYSPRDFSRHDRPARASELSRP